MNDASSMKWGITSTVDVVVDVDGRAGAEGSSSSTMWKEMCPHEELNEHKRKYYPLSAVTT